MKSSNNLLFSEEYNFNKLTLTLSWRRPLSYKNQSIDLLRFLYDIGLRHERVKVLQNKQLPSLVDFNGLYQLLHSQIRRNGLKLWISNVKICIESCVVTGRLVALKLHNWTLT